MENLKSSILTFMKVNDFKSNIFLYIEHNVFMIKVKNSSNYQFYIKEDLVDFHLIYHLILLFHLSIRIQIEMFTKIN